LFPSLSAEKTGKAVRQQVEKSYTRREKRVKEAKK